MRFALLSFIILSAGCSSSEYFHIKPVRPVDELITEALKSSPPAETGEFRENELTEIVKLDSTVRLDIRYATENNFLSTPLYSQPRAFLQKPAAEALIRVQKKLKSRGFGIMIHDAYRPWYVTKVFWEATPADLHNFVADPSRGSKHNRGCAVDLTLINLKTGKPVPMPSLYDEMSGRAYADYTGGTETERANRDLLRSAMEEEGFAVYEFEWWHYDYKDWQLYKIQNVKFEEIK